MVANAVFHAKVILHKVCNLIFLVSLHSHELSTFGVQFLPNLVRFVEFRTGFHELQVRCHFIAPSITYRKVILKCIYNNNNVE